jgi:endogenous inhibitor of DNA gyrase (YacG/DUF329 family)
MAQIRCPTCGKRFESQQSPAMPFCSERCRLLDLGRWLGERYGVPCEAEEVADEPDDEPPGGES